MHRVRVAKEQLRSGAVRLRGAELRHLRDVLRMGRGARIEVFDGEGGSFVAEVTAIGGSAADLTVLDATLRRTESPLALTLAVAIAKGAKLDWVVEKATELGVSRIVPFTCERSIPERAEFASRGKRWRRIAAAAAAQSGRTVSPPVDDVVTFPDIVQRARRHDRSLLFWERGVDALGTRDGPDVRDVLVVTGPEGGFTEAEAADAQAGGFTICTLGPRILRAETAAVAAVALAQHGWGDLGGG
jgi:16S rRNA (uracil1498-N3)-methyltransferase